MEMLKEGDKVPDLQTTDQNGNTVRLSDFKEKTTVLYFYPRDDTPGCTKEACNFRDDIEKIKKMGAQIVGVSTDSEESHQKFVSKHNLNFTLLADKNKAISKAFGALKITGTAARISYIIGKDGTIKKVYPKVKPEEHSKQIIEDLKEVE